MFSDGRPNTTNPCKPTKKPLRISCQLYLATVRCLSSKGDVLQEAGRTDEAISAFDKAILIDSQNNYPWLAKGDIFNQTGKQEEAVKAYDKAIQIAQSSPSFLAKQVSAKAWYNKGLVLKAWATRARLMLFRQGKRAGVSGMTPTTFE